MIRRATQRFLLANLALLLLLAALILFALPSVSGQTGQATQHLGGYGGGYQAYMGQISLDVGTSTAIATATATPSPQGKMYGGLGDKNTCVTFSASIPYMVKLNFNWGMDQVSPKWQHDTTTLLCEDTWLYGLQVDTDARGAALKLGWPHDLFANPTAKVHVGGATPGDPTGIPTGSPTPGSGTFDPPPVPAICLTPSPIPFQGNWNLCDPIRALINGAASLISQTYQQSAAQLRFLWTTPLPPFQDDKIAHLLSLWNISWSMVLLCITAVIAWAALRSMVGSVVSWLSYAQLIDLLPRLILALLAALISKQIFVMLISANNAFSGVFSSSILQTIIGHPNPGIKLGLVQIVYGVMAFVFIIEEAVRVALIYILFAGSPFLCLFAALPETQIFAQAGAKATILIIFLQAIQAFTMDVGNGILSSVIQNPNSTLTPLNMMVAIAVLYIALVEFYALMSMAFGRGGYALAGGPGALVRATIGGFKVAHRASKALGGGGRGTAFTGFGGNTRNGGGGGRGSTGGGNSGSGTGRGFAGGTVGNTGSGGTGRGFAGGTVGNTGSGGTGRGFAGGTVGNTGSGGTRRGFAGGTVGNTGSGGTRRGFAGGTVGNTGGRRAAPLVQNPPAHSPGGKNVPRPRIQQAKISPRPNSQNQIHRDKGTGGKP